MAVRLVMVKKGCWGRGHSCLSKGIYTRRSDQRFHVQSKQAMENEYTQCVLEGRNAESPRSSGSTHSK